MLSGENTPRPRRLLAPSFPGEPEDGVEPESSKSSEDRHTKENPDKDQDRMNNSARPSDQAEIFAQPKPARAPSLKLESAGVNQQKRRHTTTLPDASCTGIDGTPIGEEYENRASDERDYQEYYKHRKASPLAEIEVADTRKPISQATDTTAGSEEYGGGRDAVGWRVEQLDTAEEALLRAAEMWKRNAMEGDPNAPQSKVLRAPREKRR